ncbi:MAG TPA: hypothetical protein VEL82_07495, partial [Thermoplasmata archaeon]|nr:hypothetical protein [Thermoplasmata archaeon]
PGPGMARGTGSGGTPARTSPRQLVLVGGIADCLGGAAQAALGVAPGGRYLGLAGEPLIASGVVGIAGGLVLIGLAQRGSRPRPPTWLGPVEIGLSCAALLTCFAGGWVLGFLLGSFGGWFTWRPR